MKKHLKFSGQCVLFLGILCICIRMLYHVIVPKFFYDNSAWPTTSAYLGFYEMKENTVDVLFFGSSHAASSFIPQELYNGFGITGYNLGCEQQNLVTSYFWLKEALRYQQPKAVILDCYMLFTYNAGEPLNTAESCTRKAIDYMKWSPVKKEAVETICRLDENQSLFGYYFPNIRYHSRWKELGEDDFLFSDMAAHYELKGYAPLSASCGIEDYNPFEVGTTADKQDMVPLMKEYLEKIVKLCEQKGISLILVKTPSTAENVAKFYTIQEYADKNELAFWDFNEKRLYNEIGFCFSTDNNDGGHGNFWGARKVTAYIGKMLSTQYGIEEKKDKQWENTKRYYEGMQKDCELVRINDIDEYLGALKDKRYSIFISSKEECTSYLKDSTIQKLEDLGLQALLQEKYGISYLAIVSEGKIVEQIDYGQLEANGTFGNKMIPYEVVSTGSGGSLSSITFDGAEKSKNSRGLNIVVYNNETMKVVDSVCFDTFAEENTAVR